MDADIIIVGSGIGGATTAAALAPSGRRILILERGERLADAPEATFPAAGRRRGGNGAGRFGGCGRSGR